MTCSALYNAALDFENAMSKNHFGSLKNLQQFEEHFKNHGKVPWMLQILYRTKDAKKNLYFLTVYTIFVSRVYNAH